MDDYFRYSRNMSISTWARQNDEVFRQIKAMAQDWALEDKIAKLPLTIPKGAPRKQSFYLLSNHPVLTGLFVFSLKLRMEEAGITLCNAWGAVLYPAHLYTRAAKSQDSKLSGATWTSSSRLIQQDDFLLARLPLSRAISSSALRML
ncbi:hypothetical protein Slin15195_G049800 [Septoria linicola]|uniref:Uncharacterized protein n=1 Tax=Septoria linicola TaxID=215465 RepID=A0A9Q9EHB8_9PEZI|nr:hypothetical protein Slin14017_G053330 [Septoria linicola]USW51661.1 hypothetical protein Slin15195_G049800 [Septoria linicola]